MEQQAENKTVKDVRKDWETEKAKRRICKKRVKKGLSPCFEESFIKFICLQVTNPLLSRRLQYLLTWYNAKATDNKNGYNFFRTFSYILPCTITFLSVVFSVVDNTFVSKCGYLVTAFISALITFINHRMDHRRYYENWVRYRSAAEEIKKESILFLSQCDSYECENTVEREKLFIEKIEEIANWETDNWKALLEDSNKKQQDDSQKKE